MSKEVKDVQREIYNFIEERILEGENKVQLQVILDVFCKKYNKSEPTITRYLEEMTKKKSPFRLRTWYDKNRYYTIPTVSVSFQAFFVMTLMVPVFAFIVDSIMKLPMSMFISSLVFFFGFWIGYVFKGKKDKNGS